MLFIIFKKGITILVLFQIKSECRTFCSLYLPSWFISYEYEYGLAIMQVIVGGGGGGSLCLQLDVFTLNHTVFVLNFFFFFGGGVGRVGIFCSLFYHF